MLNPRKILIAMPCYDGRVMCETAGSLWHIAGKAAALTTPAEVSHPALVRNMIAAAFMGNPQFEWLVCLDSDIVFSVEDWDLLMQPCCDELVDESNPTPTREVVEQIIGRDNRGAPLTTAKAADILVNAEYSMKNDTNTPVRLGKGFTRVHRSVFERLQALTHEDGTPRLWQAIQKGTVMYDYYPSGPFIAQIIPTVEWKGEDHGFFSLCMLAGIIPRIETRTRLTHIGRKGYQYEPNPGGGQ